MFTSTAAILDCELWLLSLSKVERNREISHRKIKHDYKHHSFCLSLWGGSLVSKVKSHLLRQTRRRRPTAKWSKAEHMLEEPFPYLANVGSPGNEVM